MKSSFGTNMYHHFFLISKNIGILCRLKHTLTKAVLIILYNTLILAYLSYCNIIWASTYKSDIAKLHIMQKKSNACYYIISLLNFCTVVVCQVTPINVYDMCQLKIGVLCKNMWIQHDCLYYLFILVITMIAITTTLDLV